jgi:hypothetical protein
LKDCKTTNRQQEIYYLAGYRNEKFQRQIARREQNWKAEISLATHHIQGIRVPPKFGHYRFCGFTALLGLARFINFLIL